MPKHIHLLSEPENETLAFALQVVKQQVARVLKSGPDDIILAKALLRLQRVER